MNLLPQGQQAPDAILAAATALGTLGPPLPGTDGNGRGEDEDLWPDSEVQPMAPLAAEGSSTGVQVSHVTAVAPGEPMTFASDAAVFGVQSASDILFPDEGDDAEEEEVDNLLRDPAVKLDWTTNVFL